MAAEKTVNEFLDIILNVLDSGNNWCKNFNAINNDSHMVSALHPTAVKWDIVGAVLVAQSQMNATKHYGNYWTVLKLLTASIPTGYKSRDLEAYNDDCEWSDIEALISAARLLIP